MSLRPCKITQFLSQLVTRRVVSGRGVIVVLYKSTYLPLLTHQVANCSKDCVNLCDLSIYIFKIMKERYFTFNDIEYLNNLNYLLLEPGLKATFVSMFDLSI